jgi:hypothetical protein
MLATCFAIFIAIGQDDLHTGLTQFGVELSVEFGISSSEILASNILVCLDISVCV